MLGWVALGPTKSFELKGVRVRGIRVIESSLYTLKANNFKEREAFLFSERARLIFLPFFQNHGKSTSLHFFFCVTQPYKK